MIKCEGFCYKILEKLKGGGKPKYLSKLKQKFSKENTYIKNQNCSEIPVVLGPGPELDLASKEGYICKYFYVIRIPS